MPSRLARSLVVVAVVAAGTAGGYALADQQGAGDDAATTAPPPTTAAAPTSGADPTVMAPAGGTEEVHTSTEAPEEVATDAPPPTPADGRAEVVVSFADWVQEAGGVEVSGFVSGAGEAPGTCVATLTRGAVTETVSAPAVPNGATTACGGLVVPGDRLSDGTWQAVLSYEAQAVVSHSDPVAVVLP